MLYCLKFLNILIEKQPKCCNVPNILTFSCKNHQNAVPSQKTQKTQIFRVWREGEGAAALDSENLGFLSFLRQYSVLVLFT